MQKDKWSAFTFQNTNTIFVNLMPSPFLSSPSTSGCYWDPEVTLRDYGGLFLICATHGKDYSAFADPLSERGNFVGHACKSTAASFYDIYTKTIAKCDCPCDDLVDVRPLKMSMMALSYIAQAIVVTIVGFNMGFRFVRSLDGERVGRVLLIGCKIRARRSFELRVWVPVWVRVGVKGSGSGSREFSFLMREGEGVSFKREGLGLWLGLRLG